MKHTYWIVGDAWNIKFFCLVYWSVMLYAILFNLILNIYTWAYRVNKFQLTRITYGTGGTTAQYQQRSSMPISTNVDVSLIDSFSTVCITRFLGKLFRKINYVKIIERTFVLLCNSFHKSLNTWTHVTLELCHRSFFKFDDANIPVTTRTIRYSVPVWKSRLLWISHGEFLR